MKKIFKIKYFVITVFIFSFIWLFGSVLTSIDFLNPIQIALSDFDIFDFRFPQEKEQYQFEDRIVIVDIANKNRKDIALLLDKINSYSPKVVAIDCFFRKFNLNDPEKFSTDSLLYQVLLRTKNLVLPIGLKSTNGKLITNETPVANSNKAFLENATQGFANFPDLEENATYTIRKFYPLYKTGNRIVNSFAAEIVKKYSPESYMKLLSRNNKTEIINFSFNFGDLLPPDDSNLGLNELTTYFLKADTVLGDFVEPSVFKEKIILLGVASFDKLSNRHFDQIYFTPMNLKSAGRSKPDMYDIGIHANIITTILRDEFIDQPSTFIFYLSNFIISYFLIVALLIIKKNEKWKHLSSLFILIFNALTLIVLFLIAYIIYKLFNFKFDIIYLFYFIILSDIIFEIYENLINLVTRLIPSIRILGFELQLRDKFL